MSSSAAVVLLVCVVVCLEGQCFSAYEDIKEGEKIGEENGVMSQVLEELQSLRDTVGKHEERFRQMTGADKRNTDEINNLKDTVRKHEESIWQMKGQITSYQAAAVDSSAFMAVMDGGDQYPDTGDVILFDHVLLNVGENYDATTSNFTCAESGLYLFSVTLYSGSIGEDTYDRVSGALIVDGVNVAEIRSANYDPDHAQYHQSAVTAMVECPQGGSVWVECLDGKTRVYGYDDQPHSIFTGYAITYSFHP